SIFFLMALIYIVWSMEFSVLAIYYFLGFFLSLIFMYAIGQLILRLIAAVLPYLDWTLRSGLNQLLHHRSSFILQFIGFNLILTALLTSSLIKTDIVRNWQSTLPASAPNYFAFNIARTDIVPLGQFFK